MSIQGEDLVIFGSDTFGDTAAADAARTGLAPSVPADAPSDPRGQARATASEENR